MRWAESSSALPPHRSLSLSGSPGIPRFFHVKDREINDARTLGGVRATIRLRGILDHRFVTADRIDNKGCASAELGTSM